MRAHISGDIRPSPIAGTWYPGNPDQLTATINSMLADAPSVEILGRIRGLMVPHAGYRYSGPIAARAFKALEGLSYKRVVVLSPMHHPYAAPLLTSAHSGYSTPLGSIPIDRETLDALGRRVPITAVRNDPEHSLEIELPFLQCVLSEPFSLIPLMLRDQSLEAASRLGTALAEVLGNVQESLLVASSDLSHFYKDQVARQLDSRLMSFVSDMNPGGIILADEEGKAFACGRGAIAAMLFATKQMGAEQVKITGYGTSADAGGDAQKVVGYGSAAVYQPAS